MGTKTKPGKFDCLDKLADDEPYFVLRGQDKWAPLLVRQWAQLAQRASINPSKVKEAFALAAAMEAWPNRKAPD